jgi:hypothetical protein
MRDAGGAVGFARALRQCSNTLKAAIPVLRPVRDNVNPVLAARGL